jgi:hypothetical protein
MQFRINASIFIRCLSFLEDLIAAIAYAFLPGIEEKEKSIDSALTKDPPS